MKYFFLLSIVTCLKAVVINAQPDTVYSVRPFGYGVIQKYYSGHDAALVNKKKRKKWINESIRTMKELSSAENIPVSEPHIVDIPDYQKITYRIQDCRTIVLKNGERILICIHSGHEDPEVGDVSVAMDIRKKRFYINYGHICGNLINFEKISVEIPVDSKSFFRFFLSDTDERKWKKW
jgi:hypothetical protein